MYANVRLLLVVVAVLAVLVPAVQATPRTYVATLDATPGFESTFSFDFGSGFTETAMITDTDFTLEVDPDVSLNGTAHFLSYSQQIDSINLPDPTGGSTPIPTGDITVEIMRGTAGTGSFNALTGAFTTSETYRVHYAGDLSAYGLTEGFVDLPSISSGAVLLDTPTGDRIEQLWEGTYTFPGTSVSLAYTCHVNTQIVPEPAGLSLLAGCVAVALLRRRR